MNVGYSNLLGEIVPAGEIEYGDCKTLQIVCTHCREPIFKAVRTRETTDTHYLAHYAAKQSFHVDCEMRAKQHVAEGYAASNRVSREQRLRYFLSVLQDALREDPLYSDGPRAGGNARLQKCPGLKKLRPLVFDQAVRRNREMLFDEGVDDFLYRLQDSGWRIETTFALEVQKRIARDVWLTTTSAPSRANYDFLFNHAYLHVMGSFAQSVEETGDPVSEAIVNGMFALTKVKKRGVNELLGMLAMTELPAGYNIIRGVPDDSERSTLLTRILGKVAEEMVGSLVAIPYFELLQRQYGDPSKTYPLAPGIKQGVES